MCASNLEIPQNFQPAMVTLPFHIKIEKKTTASILTPRARVSSQICTATPPIKISANGSCSQEHFRFLLLRYLLQLFSSLHCLCSIQAQRLTSCLFLSSPPPFLLFPSLANIIPSTNPFTLSRLYTDYISIINEHTCKSVLSNKNNCFQK